MKKQWIQDAADDNNYDVSDGDDGGGDGDDGGDDGGDNDNGKDDYSLQQYSTYHGVYVLSFFL